MTRRNANHIQADAPNSTVLTVGKGDILQPGDLKVDSNNIKRRGPDRADYEGMAGL